MEEYNVSLGVATENHENCYNKNKSSVQLLTLFPTKEKEENEIDEYWGNTSKSLCIDGRRAKERDDNDGGSGKRFRLSKDQVTGLEDTFRDHHRITNSEKLDLADKLKLRPSQVEYWFQNRRFRYKLKHQEREVEELKKLCETLKEENQRLKKELHHRMLKQKEE